jgi:hypothetical protein
MTTSAPDDHRRSLEGIAGALGPRADAPPVQHVLRAVERLARSDAGGEAELRAAFRRFAHLESGLTEGARGRLALETIWSPAVLHRLHVVAIEFIASRGVRRDFTDLIVPTPWSVLALMSAGADVRVPMHGARLLAGWTGSVTTSAPTWVDAMVVACLLSPEALGRAEAWHRAHGLSDWTHLELARWIVDAVLNGRVQSVPPHAPVADAWMRARSLRGLRRSVARKAGLQAAGGEIQEAGWLKPCATPPSRGQGAMAIEWFAAVIRGRRLVTVAAGPFIDTPQGRTLAERVRAIATAAEAAEPPATPRQSLIAWFDSIIDVDVECDEPLHEREEV